MNTDYKNWISKGMIMGFAAGTAAFSATLASIKYSVQKVIMAN